MQMANILGSNPARIHLEASRAEAGDAHEAGAARADVRRQQRAVMNRLKHARLTISDRGQ